MVMLHHEGILLVIIFDILFRIDSCIGLLIELFVVVVVELEYLMVLDLVKKPSEHVREVLDPPLSYRDGVVRQKPSIIEFHNFADQPYQLMSTVPEDEPLFQPFPPEINFFGYQAFKKYTAVLHLRNNDKVARRVQVLSQNSKLISVQPSSLHLSEQTTNEDIGSSKVACGMEVAYTVAFNPKNTDDYRLELVVVTDREKFVVPVICSGLKAVLDMPDEIFFPLTAAKCSYKKNVLIHNLGSKPATFNLKTVGAFSVTPINGVLQAGCLFQCLVCFHPPGICTYEGELQIHYIDCNDHISSKLIGTGCELEVGLSTSIVAAHPTCIRKKSHLSLQIYNHSSVVAYFLWAEYAFSLIPAKGEIWPGTVVEVSLMFCPPQPIRYICRTYCIISGKSEPLSLQLQGLGVGPVAELKETELDLGDIFLYSIYDYEVKLENKGHMEVIFRRMMPSTISSNVECIFKPDTGYLEPSEYQAIKIQVSGKSMGIFNEIFFFEIKDAVNTLKLTLRGHVNGPAFNLSVKDVNFGCVSCGLPCTRDIQLRNDSPVSLKFKFRMCSKTSSGFSVSPDLFIVRPLETKNLVIELLPLEVKSYDTVLYADIPSVGNSFASIQLRADALTPKVSLSRNLLDLGNCFLRYSYTAEVNLLNESKVHARYEVLPQNDSTKDYALVRAKTDSGIISASSIVPLEFIISTQCLGEVSLPVIIRISGKDCTELIFNICAVSKGPSLKIEQQAQTKSGNADGLEVNPALDFGKVQVLRDHEVGILVRNLSCIPASLKTFTSAKDSVFKIFPHESILEPYGLLQLQVKAYLDDAAKFKDILTITFEGGQFFIPVIAIGTGSTLLCNEVTSGSIQLGNHFTLHNFSYVFEVHNMGRRPQTLGWENETGRKLRTTKGMLMGNRGQKDYEAQQKTSTEGPAHLGLANEKTVFSIIPEKITIKPHSLSNFTIAGFATVAGAINEEFDCKVTGCQESYHLKLAVQAVISSFNLAFSLNLLKFVENNGTGDIESDLCKVLSCKNVSRLPLSFTLQVNPPFVVSQLDWTLNPSESALIEIRLESNQINSRQSMIIHEKLDILYTGTLERGSVDLVAEINYPNLHLDSDHIDFGCVFENTCKRQYLQLKNISSLEVRYAWSFYNGNTRQEHANEATISKLPVIEVYDILPTRGCLLPGEEEIVEFSFCAYPEYEGSALALCEVEEGPQYKVELKGVSGLARYHLNPKLLDFNTQAFNKISSKDLMLTNVGKVPISFQIDLRLVKRKSSLSVTPLSGELQPSEKQKLTVLVQPGIPDKFAECIKVQVAYLIPAEIFIYGDAILPYITLETTRVRNCRFLALVNQASQNLRIGFFRGGSISNSQESPQDLNLAAGETIELTNQLTTLFKKKENSQSEDSLTKLDILQPSPVLDPLMNVAKTNKLVIDGGDHEQEVSATEHALEKLEEEISDVQLCEPSIEQIDAEVDRILFKESRIDVHKLILNKYMCDFGIVVVGELRTKCIRVTNTGFLPVAFKVDMGAIKGKGFFVEPDQFVSLVASPAHRWVDLRITLRTDLPKFHTGQLEYNVPITIREGPQSLLLLRAKVVVPVLQLSTKSLEFGMTRLGQCKVMSIRLYNVGDVTCDWKLEKQESGILQTHANHDWPIFICSPEAGIITPNGYMDMQVRFMPTHKKRSYCRTFYVIVMHNPSKVCLECKGSSYSPLFSIEPSSMELGPILPHSNLPAEAKFSFQNNSHEAIEIYSLDFDSQYIREEDILRTATEYNEDGLLFLQPRDAGQPFWESLSQMPKELKALDLTKKGASEAVNVDQPLSSEKSILSDVTMPINGMEKEKPVIVLYGPPVVGKTTQAKLLSLKYGIPIVDIGKIIMCTPRKQSSNSEVAEVKLIDNQASTNSMRIQELTLFEKDLTRNIQERLQENDCKAGVVFDGLSRNPLEALSSIRCIFFAIGLEPYDPSTVQQATEAKFSKQKGGDGKGESSKKKMRNKEEIGESNSNKFKNVDDKVEGSSSFGVESEKVGGESKIIWKGSQYVYLIALKAPREGLQNRYELIPEVYHAKESFLLTPKRATGGNIDCKSEKPTLQEIKHLNVPDTNKGTSLQDLESSKKFSNALSRGSANYPYSSIFPTTEELDRFFLNEEYFYNSLGGLLSRDEAAALDHKIIGLIANGLENHVRVIEQELQNLPSPESFAEIPPPHVSQVVRKPLMKSKFSVDVSEIKFSILTPAQMLSSEDNSRVTLHKKGHPASKDLEKPVDKSSTSNRKNIKSPEHGVEEGEVAFGDSLKDVQKLSAKKLKGAPKNNVLLEGSLLDVVPDGFSKETRWILNPRSNLEVLMQFWSAETGNFTHAFTFEEVGTKNQVQLICTATCARPEVSFHYKHSPHLNSKSSSTIKRQKRPLLSEGILDFGPLPVGKSSEGFPDLPGSQHCIKVEIQNTGVFDLHAEIELIYSSDTIPQLSKNQAKRQERKNIKQSPFLFHPELMDLKVEETQDLNIYAYPNQGFLGVLEGRLICNVKDNPNLIQFQLRCLADTPRLELDLTVITFGQLLIGCEDHKDITIRNVCSLPVHWKIVGLENGPDEFRLSENKGSLLAHTIATIKVNFKAKQEKLFNQKLKLQVLEDKDSMQILQELPMSISAEAYKIEVSIKYPNPPEEMPPSGGINYGTVKVAENLLKVLVLENKGKYPIKFKFCFKIRSLAELFTITPLEGFLDSKKQQKVELHFNKEKNLQKEVNLQRSDDLKLDLIEHLNGQTEQTLSIPISLHAVHSKFSLLPANGLHFGAQLCDCIADPHSFQILNVGHFPFTFKLASINTTIPAIDTLSGNIGFADSDTAKYNPNKKDPEKAPERGKIKSSKDKKEKRISSAVEVLESDHFTLSPISGTVLPGANQTVTVYFKSSSTPLLVNEMIRITISDIDPLRYPEGILFELAGESCYPGIKVDPECIFMEHKVVDSIGGSGLLPPFGTFSIKESLFSFGLVTLNSEKVANEATAREASTTAHKIIGELSVANESSAQARFRFENPFKVPCFLKFSVIPSSEQEAPAASEESLCMEVFPETMEVPPVEYKYVTCFFRPTSMQRYSGNFQVNLRDASTKTPLVKFQLKGEGTLPQVHIKYPSSTTPSGSPWLKFPRLLVGKRMSLPIVFQNSGLVDTAVKFEPLDPTVPCFKISHHPVEQSGPCCSISTLDIPTNSETTILVTFTPFEIKQYKQEILILVNHNPFDRLTILISGEGYTEDIVCLGLPKGFEDVIWLEDCSVGESSSISFTLKNNAADKHWRFAWEEIPYLKFAPALGHLHGGASKETLVTFFASETTEYINKEVKLHIVEIVYKGVPVDWDEKISPTAAAEHLRIQAFDSSETEMKTKASKSKVRTGNQKGNSDFGGSDSLLKIDLKVGEPAIDIVKGSSKVIELRLHAVCDNARYECNVQSIAFKSTMMFQTRSFTFNLKNLGRSCMKFLWRLCLQNEKLDCTGLYVVSPLEGVILAGETVDVTIKFCPMEVENCTRLLTCDIPNLALEVQPLRIPIMGQIARPWCHFELPKSDYASRHDINLLGPNGEVGSLDPAINIIEFESLGSNTQNVKYFTALNPTNINYRFVWEPKQRQHTQRQTSEQTVILKNEYLPDPFKCLTWSGEILSGKRYEMSFEYTPNKLGLLESFWTFKIPDQNIEVQFLFVGNFKKPELMFDPSLVDFGQVLVGTRVKRVVNLKNPEVVPFTFSFDKLSYAPMQQEDKPVVHLNPPTGEVSKNALMPVEVSFSPIAEGRHNFNVICNLMKAMQLSLVIKGEGCMYHEKIYIEAGNDGVPSELVVNEAKTVEFGHVLINSTLYTKCILTNSGSFPFSFLWDIGKSKLVNVEPMAGIVGKEEQFTCDISFCPTIPGKVEAIPVFCHIGKIRKYQLVLSCTCYRPNVKLSFSEYDFGPRFVYLLGQTPASTILTLSNEGLEPLTCESLYESTSFLEVPQISISLAPGQSHSLTILFKPEHICSYKKTIKFQINGLDTVVATIKGEGVPVVLELVDGKQHLLSFGMLRLGKTVQQQVQIINKSKIPVEVACEPCQDTLSRYGVTCKPQTLHLPSKKTGAIDLQFNPQSRMASFTEDLLIEAAGTKLKLLSVSGRCLGVEMKLSMICIPFDMVTLGSQIIKKMQLENCGDLGASFLWDISKCDSQFNIFPLEGFLAPQQLAKLEVTFHPTRASADIRVEGIPCHISSGETLYLALTGSCTESTVCQELLNFKAPVRSTEIKTIQINNDTSSDWLLHPKITNLFWSGPASFAVPAGQTAGYSLIYRPTTMCLPSTNVHTACILFPLPDGSAISYQLTGEAGSPLPDGNIKIEGKARCKIPISLTLKNWLKVPQNFNVSIYLDKPEVSTTLKGPSMIDVASLSTKVCQISFEAQKPGSSNATIIFKNGQSGEYAFFNLSFVIAKADVVGQVSFDCLVRQRVINTVLLKNPLETTVYFQTRCTDADIVVPSTVELQPKSTASVPIAFRTLFERANTCLLTFENDLLGDFDYELKLRSTSPGFEPPLSFSVSLGNRVAQVFTFKHYPQTKSTYTCVISQRGIEEGFTVEPSVAAKPAGVDGQELHVQVMFEPTEVTDKAEGLLTVKSQEGGEYYCKLHGTCTPPHPQGPILIKGSGQINFRNVFDKPVQFFYATDNPAFVVSKGEKFAGKKVSKLVVSYKEAPGAAKTGKLTVSCTETTYLWVFYLQAL
ncbi:hypothetical protein O6H91_12G067600 [Diphasiastrum complanatum]|uniref:Uncharacterized protein n=1 Tax=Diphasiastrum complanatum TaxID=34168 RepID=A0ACC2C408_DIPCM|nr:hypothetical protein O6H91_12G067600 [Diphasiastrum complanatum]